MDNRLLPVISYSNHALRVFRNEDDIAGSICTAQRQNESRPFWPQTYADFICLGAAEYMETYGALTHSLARQWAQNQHCVARNEIRR
ncbi:hypothetical protein BRADI_5g10925v3 [Brachypodium distachyon]|uniref:Uncharacterized protein n=1 Tax=Brachypodium distachyon TaxID=15368 RepID=A0A2K2CGJ5_BRADI|nr:hypothetical protein BRADI_5g10925v3 [Brachypodium distachyon]